MKHIDDLDFILEESWGLLQRKHQQASPIRTPVLATRGLDGQANARTIVLRRVEPKNRKLFVNTDSRSPKYAEILAHPKGTFVFFDPEAETQLRMYTEICIHQNNELTYRAWNELPIHGRRIYETMVSPGRPAAKPTSGLPRQDEDYNAGYKNFVVLEATVNHLDWLYFSEHGHRRASFTWDKEGVLHTSWLYP
jgi:pyridoxamine 5'-phosphate oxidase